MTRIELNLLCILCAELGVYVRRKPQVGELGLLKDRLVRYAESKDENIRLEIGLYCNSVFGVLLDPSDDSVWADLYQIASFLLKKKEREIDEKKQTDYINKMLEINRTNRGQRIDQRNYALRHAKAIMRRLTQTLDLRAENIARNGRHGPGAVLEGATLDDKNFVFLATRCRQIEAYFGVDWNCSSVAHPIVSPDMGLPRVSNLLERYQYTHVTSKLTLVAKNYKSCRGVLTHPTAAMFLQLGIDRAIRKWFRRSVLRNVWSPESQLPNQECAYIGSYCKLWATLDLSDASDRISTDLLRWLFARNDFRAMMCVKSQYVLLPDRAKPLRNYIVAPMGDGKTFALLTLICTVLSLAAMLNQDGVLLNDPGYQVKLRTAASKLHVFGDDICCHQQYAAAIIENLEAAGLKVNKDKSFIRGSFRESCGLDALNGRDVTPIRLKTCLDGRYEAADVESLIALHNRVVSKRPAWTRMIKYLRWLIRKAEPRVTYTLNSERHPTRLQISYREVGVDPDLTLLSYIRKTARPIRWNEEIQVWQVKCFSGSKDPCQIYDTRNDWYRYNAALFPQNALRWADGTLGLPAETRQALGLSERASRAVRWQDIV